MYHERADHSDLFGQPDAFPQVGTGRHRAAADPFLDAPMSTDPTWDPTEELAFILQDAMEERREPRLKFPAGRDDPDPLPDSPLSNLQAITEELPPVRRVHRGHRRVRERRNYSRLRVLSLIVAGLAAAIASAVSFFGGMVAYGPLHLVAESRTSDGMVAWWPLLVYGPWVVAALSVLRAALHQRRAVHSWCVVLFFSATAVVMCVLQSPRSVTGHMVAALPCIASLACFQQLIRQITLTRPPRRAVPRHRVRRPTPDTPPATPPKTPQAPRRKTL